jgi:hypothetical protein
MRGAEGRVVSKGVLGLKKRVKKEETSERERRRREKTERRSAQRRTVDSFWGKTIRYDTDTIRYDTTDDTRRHITKNNTTRDIRITLRLSRHYDITGTTWRSKDIKTKGTHQKTFPKRKNTPNERHSKRKNTHQKTFPKRKRKGSTRLSEIRYERITSMKNDTKRPNIPHPAHTRIINHSAHSPPKKKKRKRSRVIS